MGLKERLQRLDSQALGEPLSREAAAALLMTRRPKYSTRAMIAAFVIGVACVAGAAGAFNLSRHRLVALAIITLSLGVMALVFRNAERKAADSVHSRVPDDV